MRATDDSDDDGGESVLLLFPIRAFPEDLEMGRYGPRSTTLEIADNDGEKAVTVSFEAANYTAEEGGSDATVRLRLDAAAGRAVTIPLTTSNRSARSGDDSGVPSSVTFGASETVKSFTLTATDDSADDDLESVAIGFGPLPSRVSAGSPSQAVVNLTDNDGDEDMLTITFDAGAGTEGAPSRAARPALLSGARESQVGSALLHRPDLRPGSGQLRDRIHSEVAFAAEHQKLRDARCFASPTPCTREKPPAPKAQMIRELT